LPKEEIVQICTTFGDKLSNVVFQDAKLERENVVTASKEEAKAVMIEKLGEAGCCDISLHLAFEELQEKLDRNNILDNGRRFDARS
jgi:polyribonucleotide nucleotidyltransferase